MRSKYYCRHRMMLFAAISMLILLSGCGRDQAVSADAPTLTTVTSDTTVGDSAAAGTSEDTTAGSDSTVPKASDDVTVQEGTESAQMDADEEQMEIDEETRRLLTAELLEENELDASVVESGRSTRSCTFDLPEGFEKSQDVEGLYVTRRYPLDTSMIYYETLDGDISLQLMTEEMFRQQVEGNLRSLYGEDIEVGIDSYENVKIDGYPAFRILCHYEVDEIVITQLEYVINADKTYIITYSQTDDYDWMEEFKTSAATISVK